jgi:cyclo(L-tyrosyl-L-tyrosyl) synthase
MELSEISEVEVCPIGEQSATIFQERNHIFIGISPFNSYYSEDRIFTLAKFGLDNFNKMNLFMPDFISRYTLEARGYSEKDAILKTKKQDNGLINKAKKALLKIGISEEESKKIIITMSDLIGNDRYQDVYNNCLNMFETNNDFKSGCIKTSRNILCANRDKSKISEHNENIAIKYFLYELPLFINTPYILDLKSSIFSYHEPSSYVIEMFKNRFMVASNQGYLKLQINNMELSEAYCG